MVTNIYHRHRHIDRHTDRQTGRQADRQTYIHTDRQAGRQTDAHTHADTHLVGSGIRICSTRYISVCHKVVIKGRQH